MMMIRFPLKPASINATPHSDHRSENCLALLILFVVVFSDLWSECGVAFILLDVLVNIFGSFKLFCYDKCLLHGLHPCIAVIKRPGST